MKRKKESILLVAVIIGLILYLAIRDSDRTHYQLPGLPDIAEKRISRIEIFKTGQPIVLKKEGEQWYIDPEAYPADPGKVRNMLNTIKKLTLTALVSESKNYIRYDLNEDKKITVKVWMGNTLSRDFDIGKPAGTYRHTFIKLAGDPNVYHALGDFRREFDQTVHKLRDMTVLAFDPDDIREINVLMDEETITVGRKEISAADSSRVSGAEPVWLTSGGKEVEASGLKRLFSLLSGMKCEEYIADRKKDDFREPVYNIVLKGSREYFLSILARTDKYGALYPGVSSENDYPFLLAEYPVNELKKNVEELIKKEKK